ncbi:MAG: peptidylprolyl isomerase [Planctomycetes bacterium]|nr:peptidylprolyl isomerase [Planctomycetota bacterium]
MREIEAQILFNRGKFAEAAALYEEFAKAGNEQAAEIAKIARQYAAYLEEELALQASEKEKDDLPRVKLVTDKGEIVLELFEDHAPNTVANFLALVEKGFYDGMRFHRVIPNFMAQGGDPNSKDEDPANDGGGGPGYRIKDETGPGFRRHFPGVLSMAKTGEPDTGGSQFFITFAPTTHLDGIHTAFGRVIEGMDVLYQLRKGTVLSKAVVLRKRDHAYEPETIK